MASDVILCTAFSMKGKKCYNTLVSKLVLRYGDLLGAKARDNTVLLPDTLTSDWINAMSYVPRILFKGVWCSCLHTFSHMLYWCHISNV
jgi:hypothetical protein